MADLVAVRLKSHGDDVDPGLMPREYFEKYGKDKGYVEVSSSDGLDSKTVAELQELLPEGVTVPSGAKKADYIAAIRGV